MINSSLENFKDRYGLLLVALFCLAIASLTHKSNPRPDIRLSKQDSAYTLNSKFLKFISLGNKRVFSNILWILTLLESDQEKYQKGDSADWMYVRFHTIATLDPHFYHNYLFGGMYLSTIKDDLEGAAIIYEMGIKEFPGDYYLTYYAGFNYFYEMGEFKKGFEKLKQIENHPKLNPHLRSVIGKLSFELTKNYDLAIEFIKESMTLARDETIKSKLQRDLYAVHAQRDLECLNAGRSGCYLVDLDGKSYIKEKDGKWRAVKMFKPYQIFRSDKVKAAHPTSR
jgi:tetratricopeptide (TPR) repeat protein